MELKYVVFLFLVFIESHVWGQKLLTHDEQLEQQLYCSGLVHRPLPLDVSKSFETNGWKKEILRSDTLDIDKNSEAWTHLGEGRMSFCNNGVLLQFATSTGKRAIGSPSDPDYAIYGTSGIAYQVQGCNWENYNRIAFSIYPDCEGARVVNMNLTFVNADVPKKDGYNEPSGNHLINLVNKEWNHCFLEIDEYQRDKVVEIMFSTSLKGRDLTTGDSATYYIRNICLQTVKCPEKVSGWQPMDNRIIYSTSGYDQNTPKTAIVRLGQYKDFQLLGKHDDEVVFQGKIHPIKTSIGRYGVLDFSDFNKSGDFRLKMGDYVTPDFYVGKDIWQNSAWRVLNYIFAQRCGHPVPGKHATCHTDLICEHDGKRISYSGGWHDAGDLSQQTLQTGDVTYALLEASNRWKERNPALAARLREEAEWGLEFILKTRFGDGYRASSMGLLIWQDGVFGTLDDISSVRKQNMAFDNFLYAGYEAYASMSLTDDPMYQEFLQKVAEEDFAFAMEKFQKEGYDKFVQPYEHSYNTSKSQYMATISWSASQLYRLTGNKKYAEWAVEYIQYVLDCQRTVPLNDKEGTRGFFYRDKERKSIVHYIHQSREQVYMQALALLCETQQQHPQRAQWVESIRLYADYLKGLMKYTKPYGMIPSGVYHVDEYKDTESFYALHLFPPQDAPKLYAEQIRRGIKLDEEHYVKRFPVWFNIFNGNTAVHLSQGKAAAICGHFLKDQELLEIGQEQLYWTVGKNPFGQSLIYGEGYNYPQLNSFSSGEITGAIPVGIRTLGNEDIPYWPQTNNACYKEVWLTSAGKWLSLIAEY